MAIRILSGHGVEVTFAPEDIEFGGVPEVLPIIRREQSASNWCWAACAQMVLEHAQHVDAEQSDIVNAALSRNDCSDPSRAEDVSACNKTRNSLQIKQIYEDLEITCVVNPGGQGQMSFGDIVHEIDGKRPVQVGIRWNRGGGHVVLVVGYSGSDMVFVHDPWRGREGGLMQYSYLLTAYGDGEWTHTWGSLEKESP